MRKLMIVASALAAVMSLGAMSTASAAEVHPDRKPTTGQAVARVTNPLDLLWKHRPQPKPVRPAYTNVRRDSDDRDGRVTPQPVPAHVAGHEVRTPVQQPSHASHGGQNTKDKDRDSARGDRR